VGGGRKKVPTFKDLCYYTNDMWIRNNSCKERKKQRGVYTLGNRYTSFPQEWVVIMGKKSERGKEKARKCDKRQEERGRREI
jgi:hypothetical protein